MATTAELLQVVQEEVARFAAEGPSADELERTQSYLCGLYPLSLETHNQLAERLSDLALFDLDDREVAHFRDHVRAVTREDCRAVAQRYFPGANPLVVVVGPARALARPLSKFGRVRVVPAGKFA